MTAPIVRDLDALLPCFRERVDVLLERLRADGWNIQVWETLRSQARVDMLVKRGTGSPNSVHRWGAAIDIVENDRTPWTLNRPGLWAAIAAHAKALGLASVAGDGPHVQAISSRYDRQLAKILAAERDAWVRERMAPIGKPAA